MAKRRFRVTAGSIVEGKKKYKAGQTLWSDKDLVALHVNKVELLPGGTAPDERRSPKAEATAIDARPSGSQPGDRDHLGEEAETPTPPEEDVELTEPEPGEEPSEEQAAEEEDSEETAKP